MTNVEVRIRSSYNTLSVTERKAADYFLEHIQEIYNLPIAQMAEESGVSPTAWVRLCKAIGYKGLKEMRKQLYAERADEPQTGQSDVYFADLKEGSNARQILNTVSSTSAQAIHGTAKMLDQQALDEAANCILEANSIRIFGMGASALVAEDFYNKLLRINKNAVFSRDSHVQLSYSSTMTPNDVAVFVSNTGSTLETLQSMEAAKSSGCKTIGITRYSKKSPLSTGCDILLFTASPEVYIRSGAMSSRLAQLMTVDVLFTLIASKDYSAIKQPLENSYKICRTHRVSI